MGIYMGPISGNPYGGEVGCAIWLHVGPICANPNGLVWASPYGTHILHTISTLFRIYRHGSFFSYIIFRNPILEDFRCAVMHIVAFDGIVVEPASVRPCARACVPPSVHIFKLEYL